MNLLSFLNVLSIISNSSIAIFLFLKGKKISDMLFGCVALSLSLWCFASTMFALSPQLDNSVSMIWHQIGYTAVIILPILYTHFVLKYLKLQKKTLVITIYFFCCIFLFFNWYDKSRFFLGELRFVFGSLYWIDWPKVKSPIFLFFFFLFYWVLLGYSFLLLINRYRHALGLERNRLKYLITGSAIGWIGGELLYLPTFRLDTFAPQYIIYILFSFGILLTAAYPFFITYGILKYRLMDIRVVITRTGIFIAVYAAILGIPFVIATRFQGLLLNLFGSKWWIFPLGVMAILATVGPFVYIFLVRKAEDILFRDQRHYQNTLRELSKTLIRIRDLDQLSKAIVLTIANTVKTSFAAIYLKEEETKSYRLKQSFPETGHAGLDDFISYDSVFVRTLQQHKRPFTSEEIGSEKINSQVGLIIPCFMEDDLLGFMVLGAKPNNQVFSPDDILIFETFSYSASLAIENCIFWREIEDRHRKARLQEMDTFSYSLAHEIDNPMTFVYNLARFLKGHFVKYITDIKEREEVEEMCDIIKDGSQRVMSMVKAIRQFGQKTTGELEPLNLQETIEGFFKLYAPELKANFVLFSKDLPQEPIYVKGAAAELQQVLIILAKNSIHAMQSSQTKQLTIKLTKVNHNTARVAVSDTGYGIRKESLHTIFEPFFTTKASSEGTGMGLHNAKGFIIRHKGRIWAESEGKDRGAAFIFELPIIEWQPPQKQEEKGKTEWAY